ncbi:hypothetical protein [Caballeronia sordidicola]|uniref:Uncharacterized protein n=1 Tax=Caballeronia sordidicola TaxID=196367 RepID=A0A242N789_CABSO|nr:hypothetical protein [Caballeronia sordidicola]OTP79463.1 hypothetical protein PAMC26577_00950 [Caballeronia sordidicola]
MQANFKAAGSLMGMKVVVNPLCDDVQRMHPSPRFAELMPPEFVAELDAWMLKFFGTQNLTYKLGDGTIVTGPKTYGALLGQL